MKSILQKIVFSFIVVLVTSISAYAQVPQGFNFQAVARGATGDILADQALGVQVSIIKGTEDGNPLYQESHTITTNPLGLIQIVIGEGTPVEGQDFSTIDFGNDNYFVRLAIDPSGGTEYEDLGTTRLLSVPYALVAQKAIEVGSGVGGIITNFNLDTANPDSSFIVNVTGTQAGSAIIASSSTDGANTGIEGKALSAAVNAEFQVGTYGEALGEGTGVHIAVFGSAANPEGVGTVGRRYGLYGQARSVGRENIGSFGIGLGSGDGEIVLEGEEIEENFGGFNVGSIGFSRGNLNGNIGVRGRVYGVQGSRLNTGVQGFAEAAAPARNIGVDAFALNSQSGNISYRGTANGAGVRNVGLQLHVNNGSSNVGAEIFADTAAILNGFTQVNSNFHVNGDITHSGTITQTSDRNLKENIKPLESGISTIMKLHPTSYNFRGDGEYKGLKLSRGLHYGLIAQEVEEVLPSLVKNNKHTYLAPAEGVGPNNPEEKTEVKNMDYKTMNYTELIPLLIKAVQEQQEEIEKLREQIESLKKDK